MFESLSMGKSDHQRVIEMLSAYIDGELSAKERTGVDRHLSGCADCRWELETLRQTVGLLGQLPAVPAPRSFTIRQMDVAPRAAPSLSPWTYTALWGATALAALLLAVVVAGDLFLHTAMRGAAPAMAPAREMAAPTQVAQAPQYPTAAPTPTVVVEQEVEKAVEEAVADSAATDTLQPRSEPVPAPMATPSPVPQGMAVAPPTVTPEPEISEAPALEKGAGGRDAEATAPPLPAAVPPREEAPELPATPEGQQATQMPAAEPKAVLTATATLVATATLWPSDKAQDKPPSTPAPSPTPVAVAGGMAATPTAHAEHEPRGAITPDGRMWLAPVRVAEASLCLLVVILAAITVVVGRRRRNG